MFVVCVVYRTGTVPSVGAYAYEDEREYKKLLGINDERINGLRERQYVCVSVSDSVAEEY